MLNHVQGHGYGFLRPGLKTGMGNGIFLSEIGSGFGDAGGTSHQKFRGLPPRAYASKYRGRQTTKQKKILVRSIKVLISTLFLILQSSMKIMNMMIRPKTMKTMIMKKKTCSMARKVSKITCERHHF